MASGLRMDRRRNLAKFDRLCDRATVIIDSRGSRTALEHLLPELGAALTALHEDYDQKLPNLENDEARAQEELHINHVDTKYQSVYDAIKQYLIDRKDDACSTTSSAPSSAAASQLSAAADTLRRVKRLEDEQLRERMKLELQRNELYVKIKLQESEDAVAAAALQLQLAKAAEDPLAWERRADFDDEAVAVKLQRNDPVTCVNLATHADTISASLLPSSLSVVQVDVDTLPSSKHEVPIKLESQGQFIPPAACNIMTTLPHLTQLPNVSGAECTLTAVTGENAQCYPSRLNPQATSFQSHTTHPSLQSSSTSLPMLHCLPRLTLPKFSGLPFEWPHWFALFRSLVHNQQAISITEKMLHLQASVSGPARQVIAGFLYDGSMYPEAMRVLEARFGRAEDVVRTSLQTVFDCVLSPHCDSASLEAFQSKLLCAVTVLQQFGYQDDIRSSENVRRVAEKFPLSLKRQWAIHLVSRDQDGVKPDLALMDAWLWGQVQVQLRIDSISTSGKPMNGQPGRNQFSRRPESQAANRFALNTVADGEASALCPVCDGRHPLADCAEFLRLSVDDRVQVVASSSICFYCLKKGHILRSCRNARPCGIEGCRMRHHKCLHGSKRITPSQSTPKPAERGERVVAAASTRDNVVLLQVVTVDVIGRGGRRRRVNALLDPGAQTSLCEESVLDELDLDGETQQLTLRNVEGCGPTKTSKRFTLDVQPVQASATEDRIHIPEVFSVQELNVTAPRLHTSRHRHEWHHLTGVELPEYSCEKIQLLIGANVLEAVIQHEVRQGSQGQPVGVKNAFGWTLTGCVSDFNIFHERQVMHIARNPEDSTLVEHLKAWWSTESFGSKFQGQPVRSMEDERAFRILKQTSAQRGTQYEAGLLWNADEVYMPNNYTMALHRLTCLERRLSQDSELAQKYGMQIQTLINKGFARKLTESELRDHSNKSWLLPHHPVLNPKKGKVRLVFDAAAVYGGVSLNDKLLAGPDLLTNLTTVLIRFREEKVAVAGDIEHMFHQVQVIASDQPALRFLWRDMVTDRLCDVYQMTVHIFGAKCSPTVANYTLLKIAEDHCDSSPAELEAASAIRHNFYLDDFLRSEETTESAIRVQRNVTNAGKKGGFRLHKWASNSPEVMAAIPQGERSDNTNDASMPINHDQRTLGYIWDTHKDTLRLGFSMPVFKPTKRNVLRCTASVFDPLGLFAPFTLRAKLLIQEMWSRNEQWDDELDEDHRVRWRAWIEQSDGLPDVEIPRCYKD